MGTELWALKSEIVKRPTWTCPECKEKIPKNHLCYGPTHHQGPLFCSEKCVRKYESDVKK